MPLDITFSHKKTKNSMAKNFLRKIQDEKKREKSNVFENTKWLLMCVGGEDISVKIYNDWIFKVRESVPV